MALNGLWNTNKMNKMKIHRSNISKTTLYGIVLFLLILLFVIYNLFFNRDETIYFILIWAIGMLRFGLMLYGQTIIKKQNRNYTVWSISLFLFTSITLIILGQLHKIEKELNIIELNPEQDTKNANQLPNIRLGTKSNMLTEVILNNTFTLNYMIQNYSRYLKDNTSLFPILAAYELNKREVKFSIETQVALDTFSQEQGYSNFNQLLETIVQFTPEEICQKFQ